MTLGVYAGDDPVNNSDPLGLDSCGPRYCTVDPNFWVSFNMPSFQVQAPLYHAIVGVYDRGFTQQLFNGLLYIIWQRQQPSAVLKFLGSAGPSVYGYPPPPPNPCQQADTFQDYACGVAATIVWQMDSGTEWPGAAWAFYKTHQFALTFISYLMVQRYAYVIDEIWKASVKAEWLGERPSPSVLKVLLDLEHAQPPNLTSDTQAVSACEGYLWV